VQDHGDIEWFSQTREVNAKSPCTHLNDQSDTLDSEDMEKQIKPVNTWIDQVLLGLGLGMK
jgi:hypothetical protein